MTFIASTANLRSRSNRGFSLIEALTTLFITSFVAAAMCELMVSINRVSFRAQNRLSALITARTVVSQLSKEVREASAISFPQSNYGTEVTLTIPVMKKIQLPSNSYVYIPAQIATPLPEPFKNLLGKKILFDKCTYTIVPDANNLGRYQLKKRWDLEDRQGDTTLTFPPGTNASQRTQTYIVASNISGPINPITNQPDCFKGLSSAPSGITQLAAGQLSSQFSPQCQGLGISFEIISTENSSIPTNVPQSVPIHSEIFLRSNQTLTP